MKSKRMKFGTKTLVLLLSALFIFLGIGLGTYAYLKDETEPAENEFVPATVTCAVEESFDGDVKKEVAVRNTGNTPAFLRAMILIHWVDENGGVLSTTPVEGTDYSVFWGDAAWVKGSDGFWYYTKAVNPDEVTPHLIRSLTSGEAPEGHRLQVQILASAIQADPADVAEAQWGAYVNGQSLTPP